MARLTLLRIRNFKGFEAFDATFRDDGVVRIQGPNEAGKTSIIEAIRVAFEGAGEEVLRDGKNPAEIIVETDALRIKRQITRKGTKIQVEDRDTGEKMAKPGTLLRQLADVLAFRPLDLLGAQDQVAKVAETLGLKLQPEDLERALLELGFEGDEKEKETVRLLSQNAIDALRYVQVQLEHQRREAGRAAKALKIQVEDLRGKVPSGLATVSEVESAIGASRAKLLALREERARSVSADQNRAEIERLTERLTEKRTALDDMPDEEKIEADARAWYEAEVVNVERAFGEQMETLQRQLDMIQKRMEERVAALDDERQRRAASMTIATEEAIRETTKDLAEIETAIQAQRARIGDTRAPEVLDEEIVEEERREAALGGNLAQARLAEELNGKSDTLRHHQERVQTLDEVIAHYRAEPGRLLRETGIPIEKLDVAEDGRRLVFANEDGKLLPWDQHATSRRLRAAVEVLCHRIRDRELKLLCVDGVEVIDEDQRAAFFAWLDTKRADGYHVFVTEATVDPEGATIALGNG